MFGLQQLPKEGSGVMGMPMDQLKKQMAGFISGLKTPLKGSVEQMVNAMIEVWRQRDQIMTCEVRGCEYVWQTSPETIAHKQQAQQLAEKSRQDWIVKEIFADVEQKHGYPTRFGQAIH